MYCVCQQAKSAVIWTDSIRQQFGQVAELLRECTQNVIACVMAHAIIARRHTGFGAQF